MLLHDQEWQLGSLIDHLRDENQQLRIGSDELCAINFAFEAKIQRYETQYEETLSEFHARIAATESAFNSELQRYEAQYQEKLLESNDQRSAKKPASNIEVERCEANYEAKLLEVNEELAKQKKELIESNRLKKSLATRLAKLHKADTMKLDDAYFQNAFVAQYPFQY